MSRSGGLLELVARGKKDIFFHANPTVSFFHSVYMRAAPFTKEIHITKPRNVPDWGHWIDFDMEHRGDILKNTYLRITLPTWFQSEDIQANKSGLVTDLSGQTYGYTNNIGFQMLEKIQVFQDQVLLHETYGEYLEWRLRQSYTMDTTYIVGNEIGSRSETALGIGRSATLGELRIPLPILGWQHLSDPGLPLVALKSQRFRIRVYIRKLEELIVCSDGRLEPKPWNIPIQVQEVKEGPIRESYTLKRDRMNLDVSLESTCIYVQPDVQTYLKAQAIRIPFLHVQHRMYTLEDPLMTAAAIGAANAFYYTMPVDFIGSMDRLLLGFRTVASNRAGQRTNLRPPLRITSGYGDGQTFIKSLRLNIANIDRIKEGPMDRFREVTAYWKNHRMPLDLEDLQRPADIYTLTFGQYDKGIPCGTFNLTRAVLPTIYITLAAIPYDERNISRESYGLLYGEAWNVYEIWGGKGRLMFES